MTRIEVAIPMKDNVKLTRALVRDLLECHEFDVLRIFDNDSVDYETYAWLDCVREVEGVEVRHRPGASIYRMWNEALFELRQPGAHVAVLNNDIRVPPDFLGVLSRGLESSPDDVWITYPDWQEAERGSVPDGTVLATTGTRNAGGMSGYAFMVDTAAITQHGVPRIDEQFEWHCGDGDFVKQVEALEGRAGRVTGLWIEHIEGATASQHGWVRDASARDRERRVRKYGG